MHTYYSSTFKGIAFQGLLTMTIVLFGPTYSLLPPFLINAPRFLFQDFPDPQNLFVPGVTRLPCRSGFRSELLSAICPAPAPLKLF